MRALSLSYVAVSCALALASCRALGDELAETFAAAPPEYSPVPIWWWSGDPIEAGRVREQIRQFAEGGIYNVVILNLAPSGPLYGSAADEPPFLSEAWWDLFGVAVEEGKRAGVRIWFYDQFGFSGAGLQARVVRDHPGFRGVTLHREVRDVTGPAAVEMAVPVGGEAVAGFSAQLVEPEGEVAQWIWDQAATEEQAVRYFRRTFELESIAAGSHVNITADNGYMLYVNGTKLGEELVYEQSGWGRAEPFDVTRHLRLGTNVIAVRAEKLGGSAGLLLELVLGDASALPPDADPSVQPKRLVSDGRFRMSAEAPEGWSTLDFDDGAWAAADVLGPLSMPPWHAIAGMESAPGFEMGTPIRYVRNLTHRISDGVLKADVPEGAYRVQLFYTTSGGFDYQNPDAGAALLDVLHGEIERRFGHELGEAIAGSFQDEFPALPRFSVRLPAEFRERMGYDLIERLPALYDDVVDRFGEPDGPTTAQVRCAANDVAAALCEEGFFIPLFEWHDRHGMLCGYDQTVRNADPVRGEGYYVDYFKTQRHYGAPGNDMGGDQKPHQSIAELYDRPRCWIEGFHSSGWGQTLEDVATLLHPWMLNGATLFDPHAVYYSIHGSYWEWAPPDTGWRQPYYAHYPVLADYSARLCYVLSQGRLVTDVAVVHPAHTIHAYSGFGPSAARAAKASDAYWGAQNALRAARVDYLVIDEDSIMRAEVDGGVLAVGRARLRVIVLPATRVLASGTVKKLNELIDGGGAVIVVGAAARQSADRACAESEFKAMARLLVENATRIMDPGATASAVIAKAPRDVAEPIPASHRRVGDRDFYFLLSDAETPANGHARFSVNGRKLWETAAALGGRLSFTSALDGAPERWDAVTGAIAPVYNYRRGEGGTRVDVELRDTPAPLVALREPTAEDPIAIESDLEVTGWRRDGTGILVQGWPRLDATAAQAASHTARVELPDGVFEGASPSEAPLRVEVPGPFTCRIEPTCDNHDGSFAWPPSDGAIPVEVRALRFHEETPGEDAAPYRLPGFDDGQWETVLASFGPRTEYAALTQLDSREAFATAAVPSDPGPMKPVTYSLRLGINEDRVFSAALGGKGRIPEEFIDLGSVKAGLLHLVRATVTAPDDVGDLPAVLRVGGVARKRAFLNGEEVAFPGDPAARTVRAEVTLRGGPNRLELLACRDGGGRLRLFYEFLERSGAPPDSEWIWSAAADPSGWTTFVKPIDVSGAVRSAAMVVALGDLHQIRINDRLLADQGNFDPYFTSRAERYDVADFLEPGANTIEIEARDSGHPVGLLLDGLIVLEDGTEIPFVSDASWTTGPDTPARVLAGPSHGYMGDPACLLLRPRPHPLPEGGWLLDQPGPPAPFDRLVYSVGTDKPAPGWYRFRLPPGATALTLETPGEAALYVAGEPVVLGGGRAVLPNPEAERRVAALRVQSVAGYERGAALLRPITFEMGEGRIGLGSWDELGLAHYAGGLVYSKEVTLPAVDGMRVLLDLGRVRGSADVTVNGVGCGTRLWHPFRFDVTDAAKEGVNRVEIRVLNTLGPHFAVGHPSAHVHENHTKSGIFGPVTLAAVKPVTVALTRTER